MSTEHHIECGVEGDDAIGGRLHLLIDDTDVSADLKVAHLSRHFLREMPPILADMLEVAAYVYAADAAIRRGGPAARQMGHEWRRNLHFKVPVRMREVWEAPKTCRLLSETLGFLSDDVYYFHFQDHDGRSVEKAIPFLDFRDEEGWTPDEVIMFSGGLDSLAGALEALLDRQNRVALVSHSSANTMTRIQKDLAHKLSLRTAPDRVRHFPVRAQMRQGALREGTHRARSFLFAVLGMAIARSFDLSQVDFCENGVVSLNLPLLAQHVGARATRSTHPQALEGLSALFSHVLQIDAKVGNPLFCRTKTDIVKRIAELNCSDLIPLTRSCANVRTSSRMTPHCGRCSQCIDRRFAVLASGLGDIDQAIDYDVDLLTGARSGEDRELALAYVRNAKRVRAMTSSGLLRHYPEVTRALKSLNLQPDASCDRITALLNRHGQAVTGIMEQALASSDRPQQSLLALYAAAEEEEQTNIPAVKSQETLPTLLIEIDEKKKTARLDGRVDVRGAAYQTLLTFAEKHLECLGRGLSPEDYETVKATQLQDIWNVTSEATVRRRITSLRRHFEQALGSNSEDLLENLPWHGYRLRPEAISVRKTKLEKIGQLKHQAAP